jgi:hypothetical protein
VTGFASQQERLRPKNLWQSMTKKNQQHIDVLERDIQLKEKLIQVEQRNTPQVSEVPDLSILQGLFKAVDRAFQEVSRERTQLQQESFQRRMREQAKYKQQERDQGRDR